MDDKAWYILRTAAMAERQVMRRAMRDLDGVVFMPVRREAKKYRGSKRAVMKALFPGYVFIGFRDDPNRYWWRLRDVDGVLGILSQDGAPLRMPKGLVPAIIQACEAGGFDQTESEAQQAAARAAALAPGAKVRVKNGPFTSFCGKIAGLEAEDRIDVLLNLFGRQFTTTMALDDLHLPA